VRITETSHLKLVGNDSHLGEGVTRQQKIANKHFAIDALRALQSQFGD
jgi:hypothetical protein